jgi:hypothetical protein
MNLIPKEELERHIRNGGGLPSLQKQYGAKLVDQSLQAYWPWARSAKGNPSLFLLRKLFGGHQPKGIQTVEEWERICGPLPQQPATNE